CWLLHHWHWYRGGGSIRVGLEPGIGADRSIKGTQSWTGAQLPGNSRLDQFARTQPLTAQGKGRPRRLLDLFLHKLHPDATLPERLVRQVWEQWTRHSRSAHARISV